MNLVLELSFNLGCLESEIILCRILGAELKLKLELELKCIHYGMRTRIFRVSHLSSEAAVGTLTEPM